MAKPKRPTPANLVCAVTYAKDVVCDEVLFALEELFGRIEDQSERYLFSQFTDYYEDEMGPELTKFFVSFEELVERDRLADIKLETNQLEEEFSVDGARRVNLDPGYVAEAQLVLATAKGYSHRVYLCKGIYAEVTLVYQGDSFRPLEWTYPDYRSEIAIGFFNRVRQRYLGKLRKMRCR